VAESPGVDFDGAMQALLDGGLVQQEGEEFSITQEGYDYLYKNQGHRVGEG
jgi:predicted transcriptional regulator